ncbi:unnamed protein product [Moneuplotes crassus]|uniref:Uncharacterized protein n=1 Tax=Euplotes crassus TaxID=5936 RepID=A0AAD1XE21_EUPCR|nr:unnamed protein product [Moneuplotes crassus]
MTELTTDRVVQGNISDAIICQICLNILDNGRECKQCEAPFCGKCIDKYISVKRTENANQILSCPKGCPKLKLKKLHRMVQGVIDKLKVKCGISNKCNAIDTIDNIKEHEKNCKYNSIACANYQVCKSLCRRQDLDEHQKICAAFSQMNKDCRDCGDSYVKSFSLTESSSFLQQLHDRYFCKATNFVSCRFCGKIDILKIDFFDHIMNNCTVVNQNIQMHQGYSNNFIGRRDISPSITSEQSQSRERKRSKRKREIKEFDKSSKSSQGNKRNRRKPLFIVQKKEDDICEGQNPTFLQYAIEDNDEKVDVSISENRIAQQPSPSQNIRYQPEPAQPPPQIPPEPDYETPGNPDKSDEISIDQVSEEDTYHKMMHFSKEPQAVLELNPALHSEPQPAIDLQNYYKERMGSLVSPISLQNMIEEFDRVSLVSAGSVDNFDGKGREFERISSIKAKAYSQNCAMGDDFDEFQKVPR